MGLIPTPDSSGREAAFGRLDDDEKLTLGTTEGQGGARSFVLLNEAGVFNLILTSRQPEAWRFKRWLTHRRGPGAAGRGVTG